MKRSEMLSFIEDIIVMNGNTWTEDGRGKQLSNDILNAIESMGMLPPITEIKMGDKITQDNGWDKEDEA